MDGGAYPQVYTIDTGSGTTVTPLNGGPWAYHAGELVAPFLTHPRRAPPRGRLLGVNARVPTGGGWTFSSLRVVLFQFPATKVLPSSPVDDALILYDSGTSGPVTASETTSTFNDDIGINEQWFGMTWLGVAYTWTTSAGSGSSSLIITPHVALQGW